MLELIYITLIVMSFKFSELKQCFNIYGKDRQTMTLQCCNWIFATYL